MPAAHCMGRMHLRQTTVICIHVWPSCTRLRREEDRAKEEIRCQDGIFTKLVRIAMLTKGFKGFRPTTRLNDNDGFKSLVTAMIIQMTMYYTSNSSLEIWEARAIDAAARGSRGEVKR